MTTAQIIGQIGLTMMFVPLFGYGIYVGISTLISDYKYAKFKDEVDNTNHHTRHCVIQIMLVLWFVIASILTITACVLSSN